MVAKLQHTVILTRAVLVEPSGPMHPALTILTGTPSSVSKYAKLYWIDATSATTSKRTIKRQPTLRLPH